MTITVLLFASYAEKLGTTSLSVEVSDGATVGDVLGRVRQLAEGHRLPDAPLVAVNQRYARRETRVAPGDEVAIIPPVAGG